MFKKPGFKIIAISGVIAITLTLGMASIGFCGGGFGPPFVPKKSGPSFTGYLVINGDILNKVTTVVFIGKCSKNDVAIMHDLTIPPSPNFPMPLDANDMLDVFLPGGQALLSGACSPKEADALTPLIVDSVSSFNRIVNPSGDTVLAKVNLKWLFVK
ncbi:MAG: hypothetical protein ACYSTS_09700 [Planctomycetota bacterium]|jgi:hypothetical protein